MSWKSQKLEIEHRKQAKCLNCTVLRQNLARFEFDGSDTLPKISHVYHCLTSGLATEGTSCTGLLGEECCMIQDSQYSWVIFVIFLFHDASDVFSVGEWSGLLAGQFSAGIHAAVTDAVGIFKGLRWNWCHLDWSAYVLKAVNTFQHWWCLTCASWQLHRH